MLVQWVYLLIQSVLGLLVSSNVLRTILGARNTEGNKSVKTLDLKPSESNR